MAIAAKVVNGAPIHAHICQTYKNSKAEVRKGSLDDTKPKHKLPKALNSCRETSDPVTVDLGSRVPSLENY